MTARTATLTAGDNTFAFSTTVAGATAGGTKSLPCTIADAQKPHQRARRSPSLSSCSFPSARSTGPSPIRDSCATHASPYAGQIVTVQGVIYETTLQAISNSTNTYKGFFIQNTSATADNDPNTSDGLFVFMNTAQHDRAATRPPSETRSSLSGTVSEYYNMTELTSPFLVKRSCAAAWTSTPRCRRSWPNPPVGPGRCQLLLGTAAGHARAGAGRTASSSAGATSSARPTPRSGWRRPTARSRNGPTSTRAGPSATPIRSTTTTTRPTGTATATAS